MCQTVVFLTYSVTTKPHVWQTARCNVIVDKETVFIAAETIQVIENSICNYLVHKLVVLGLCFEEKVPKKTLIQMLKWEYFLDFIVIYGAKFNIWGF